MRFLIGTGVLFLMYPALWADAESEQNCQDAFNHNNLLTAVYSSEHGLVPDKWVKLDVDSIPKEITYKDAYRVEKEIVQSFFVPFLMDFYGFPADKKPPFEFIFREDQDRTSEIYDVVYDLHYDGIKVHKTHLKLQFVNKKLDRFNFRFGLPLNWNPKNWVPMTPTESFEEGSRDFFKTFKGKVKEALDLAHDDLEPSAYRRVYVRNRKEKKWVLVDSFLVEADTPTVVPKKRIQLNVDVLTGQVLLTSI